MSPIKKLAAAAAAALALLVGLALPAAAYTVDYSYKLCTSSNSATSYNVALDATWHQSNAGDTVNLYKAVLSNTHSLDPWVITTSRWEDLTTGQVQRGWTGTLEQGWAAAKTWYPTNWYKTADNLRWAVAGYNAHNPSITISSDCHLRR